LIILDEPVSSLDVTIQAQILALLKELQKKYNLTYIFISHDLNVIFQICNRVCVIYQGEIVEMKEAVELFFHPQHEYTKELLKSAMIQDVE
jgi:peptide/nickel transport system ATP-binding protein